TPAEIMACPESLTGRYLSGATPMLQRAEPRPLTGKWITITGASEHNLQDITIRIPLSVMTVVTGVSGSGKSTLINDILYRSLAQSIYGSREEPGAHESLTGAEQLDKVVRIDQSPIGRTPRSNPATYTQVFSPIRDLFSMLPEARERGYKPGRFSFNVSGGRCEACQGDGQRRIEMNFMPDVYVQCEICNGRRYNQETLAVKFKGHSIADILELTIEDALTVLTDVPQVRQKLQTLVDVGLGYVHLGQSATTLSGGEAQRMKLARELSKRQTGRTLYLLDEPTTGLHFDDVRKLLEVLHRLADLGNTVIIIEHNLDVIRNADWILDLGPEGGEDGGRVVGEGRPAKIAATPASYTGQFLARYYKSSNGRLVLDAELNMGAPGPDFGTWDTTNADGSMVHQELGAPSMPRPSAQWVGNDESKPEKTDLKPAKKASRKPTAAKKVTKTAVKKTAAKKTAKKKSAPRRK
ncbi:MAG: excinuclease ABC subunit A, partial [Terracidiphilus sp.]